MATSLQDLVNEAVFLSTETQVHFGSLIAGAQWSADLSGNPTLTFDTETPIVTTPHLVGSAATGPGTWHWGWDNINEFPAVLVESSQKVRAFGASNGITEFVDEELPLDDEELPLRLALAAKAITGIFAHYPSDAGGGTQVWFLVEHPTLGLPEPSIQRIATVISQGLVQTVISDHRAAVAAYVRRRGIPTAELADGGLRLLAADGSADVEFDAQNRIVKFEMAAPLSGEAAQQYSGSPAADSSPAGATAAGAVAGATAPAPSAPQVSAAADTGTPAGSGADAAADGRVSPDARGPESGTPAAPTTESPVTSDAPAASTAPGQDAPVPVAEGSVPTTTDPRVAEPAAGTPAGGHAPDQQPADRPVDVQPAGEQPTGGQPAGEDQPAATVQDGDHDPRISAPAAAEGEAASERPAPRSARDAADEPRQQEPEKKGFFKKLFGR